MTTNQGIRSQRAAGWALLPLAVLFAACLCPNVGAYPPGPYHIVYGTVRDQYGTPLSSVQASVILETPSGLQISGPIVPGIGPPGVNYQLKVPLDSGVTPDLYLPNVLVPAAQYKLVVLIGSVTNLPIGMSTNEFLMGQWAQTTRLDLTLGVDSNGDGIPDAWEYAFLAALGTNVPLSLINANTILTSDGLTIRQEFILGNVLFDPGVPFVIQFVGFNGTSPIVQFPTVMGRTYTVLQSTDLKNWSPVPFNLPSDAAGFPPRAFYFAPGTSSIQVYLSPPGPGVMRLFYRAEVQ
jgi:hypothetical protein